MSKLKYALAGIMLFSSTQAIALEEIAVGAGSSSGEYTNTIIPALSKALAEFGYRAKAVISEGSQSNINQVLSGDLVAGLTQFDVAALNMTAEKDPDENLVLLGRISPEALFCAAQKNGRVKSYHDITDVQSSPLKISVGSENSGTAKTFQFLMSLDPELTSSKVELLYSSNVGVELNRLVSGRRDLVCFVMAPNPDNERIKMVVENPELTFISIDEPLFAAARVSGMNVYDIMEVPISSGMLGFNQVKIKTLVTWVGVIVNESLADEKLLSALSTVAMRSDLLPENSLAGQATRLFGNLREMLGQ
jgi:TRAP-type uncharacterized transport system substrate-binding protein